MKYSGNFPGRFGSYEHHHSGVAYHTPGDVYYERVELIDARRSQVLGNAYDTHPERFVRKLPTPPSLRQTV